MTSGIYQRTAPRVQVLRGYWGNEPYARTFSAPVTSGVTIKSGQLISLSSGSWVLGCSAGQEPFIAFHDSTDTDVVSSGQLVGLSCAGQFVIETGYFDNTQTYVENSPLKADSGSGAYQATGATGQITLGTLSTAEDTIGFATAGGRQDNVSIDSSAAPISGHLYVLRFRTQWLPRATTAS
jgi:hypothetical protein